MLKKIVLAALFIAVSTTGTVFAHSVMKAPVPTTPRALCPRGIC